MRRAIEIWPLGGLPSSSEAMATMQTLQQWAPWPIPWVISGCGQSCATPSIAAAASPLQQYITKHAQQQSARCWSITWPCCHALQQWHHHHPRSFASLPYRLTEEIEQYTPVASRAAVYSITKTAATAGPPAEASRRSRGVSITGSSSSSSRGGTSGDDHDGDDDDSDEPRRRRRSTTESRSALRRTTESRAAIEDVAVMSKTQLLRRKKAWLAEQCWERQLPHDGLKDDLIQRLLDWQTTDQGRAAAAEAVTAAQAAMAALSAATPSFNTVVDKPSQVFSPANAAAAAARAGHGQRSTVQSNSGGSSSNVAEPSPTAATGAADGVSASIPSQLPSEETISPSNVQSEISVDISSSHHSRQPQKSGEDASAVVNGPHSSSSQSNAGQAVEQPPCNAAAAAAGSMTALLQQLQEQPDNAALIAVTRNALEMYAGRLDPNNASGRLSNPRQSGHKDSAETTAAAVQGLAAELSAHSTPHSLASLAKACYSREVQNPLLAAAVADAVAAVAAQLGPQEVYGVLRMLVEHLGTEEQGRGDSQDGAGFWAMIKGFRALAEGMIRTAAALHPRQLTEAVQLLGQHKYDDPYGLWMIARDASERLQEFEPADVVILLDAVAGMCVADDALCERVAAVVGSSKASYSQQQLQAIETALKRMGCTHKL